MVLRLRGAGVLVAHASLAGFIPAAETSVDWREGGSLAWRTTLEGRTYDVEGRVIRVEPERRLAFEYANPLIKTRHRVIIELSDDGAGTRVSVSEDGHRKDIDLAHGEGSWRLVLANLKAIVEGRTDRA